MLTDAVADVVRRQVETGLDIVNDGEFGKSFWTLYAADRLKGVEWRDETERLLMRGRDYAAFPEFYDGPCRRPACWCWNMPPAVTHEEAGLHRAALLPAGGACSATSRT